jgi:hypothetical protein
MVAPQQGAEHGDPAEEAEEAEGAAALGVAGGAAGGLLEGDPVGAGEGEQAGGAGQQGQSTCDQIETIEVLSRPES